MKQEWDIKAYYFLEVLSNGRIMNFLDGALRILLDATGGEEVRPKNFTMDNAH